MEGVLPDTRAFARRFSLYWLCWALVLSGVVIFFPINPEGILAEAEYDDSGRVKLGKGSPLEPFVAGEEPIEEFEEFLPPPREPEQKPWELTKEIEAPDSPIQDIRVEGNTSIPENFILRNVRSRTGRPPVPTQIRDDVSALLRTRWFYSVDPVFRQTTDGVILIFRVLERPMVKKVSYVGNTKVKAKQLEQLTGLKAGSGFSVSANQEAARRIQDYYHEKGYYFAEVELIKGDQEDDREIEFKIKEGNKLYVSGLKFEGNQFFSSALLTTKLETSPRRVPYIGGTYKPQTLDSDEVSLRNYYNRLGFFDVKVEVKPEFNQDKTAVTIHYNISEGLRYKVREVIVEGNQVLSQESLRKDFALKAGEYFHGDKMNRDVDGMTDKYGELGRLMAEVNASPRYLEQPGMVDVVYRIDEDRVYRIRRVDVVINGDHPHTKDTVILNNMLVAPGDLANKKLIEKSERRIKGSQLFDGNVLAGTAPKIHIRPVPDAVSRNQPDQGIVRAQAWEEKSATSTKPRATQPLTPIKHRGTSRLLLPVNATDGAEKPAKTRSRLPDEEAAIRRLFDEPYLVRGQSPAIELAQTGDPLINGDVLRDPLSNPGATPLIDQPPGWVDLVPEVSETQTGRIMLGAGYSSNNGVNGSAILEENNFDILRPPTSINDFFNGTAWRGGGQQFRLEALPGNQLQRYMVTWRDPFFLDTNFSLGVSGYYYSRFFQSWTEARAGGRITIGRQFDNYWSGTMAFKLEDVELSDPQTPTPALLSQALGHSFLSSVRVGLQHDTRDSPYLASEGHFLEAAFEQAFGTFDYPRVDLDARQYYTLYRRPDGEGRHILALSGQLGYSGAHTPIFERYYAGGYSSFRGFSFRGITPRDLGVGIGGQFMLTGSAEYIFPITASEMVRGVVFTDFGSVENNVTLNHFRMSVGAGVRLTVPAMGPLPIALDLAWPLLAEDDDDTRVFSFSMGLSR